MLRTRPELISVIVCTYNWAEALTAVLFGLQKQTDCNFEIVVADDGSDHRTLEVIKAAPMPVAHVWHEHQGFRAAEIRNRATLASRGDYVIFLDGDCIPRPSFVATHRRLAEPGYFVQGNRIDVGKTLTQRILTEKLTPEKWSLLRWRWYRIGKRINRVSPVMNLPLGSLRKHTKQTSERAQSCNQAFWRKDLDSVDGFDATYRGWGWEDNDLLARMLHSGVRKKSGSYATGVIHLYHEPTYSRENRRLFDDTLAVRRIAARLGMSAISPAALVAPAASTRGQALV
jgi:glycosyltransferase involved in cell wall biosynthesis